MDYDKLIHCLKCCARVDAQNEGCDDCDLEYCGEECQQLCGTAATAIETLQAENEKLKDQLYDGEGVNLVNYWIQQAKIEENGHRNCQAENEKLRAELERVTAERDAAEKEITRLKAIMREKGIFTIPAKYPWEKPEWNW